MLTQWFALYLQVSEDALEDNGKRYDQSRGPGISVWCWYTGQTGGGGKKQSWGDALEDFVGIPGIHEYLDYDINSTNEKWKHINERYKWRLHKAWQ